MGLVLKQSENTEYEIVPEGQYIGRCCKVIDYGTQTVTTKFGVKQQPKIAITWELLDEDKRMKDGKPFLITSVYTATLDDRGNLYRDLVAWRGRKFSATELENFDISKLLGAYCGMQVIHNQVADKTYANVNTLFETKERPEPVNPNVMFDLGNPDMEVFESFSDYLKNKIRSSAEWNEQGEDEITSREVDDIEGEPIDLKDVPF